MTIITDGTVLKDALDELLYSPLIVGYYVGGLHIDYNRQSVGVD
ncbi:MAG TPA: hypothetical protein VEL11_11180 [Candidatus Bathyarchaeia archaeon]|nr:hypothetical protein [Candidatus Bathyarchaeia archaeon]